MLTSLGRSCHTSKQSCRKRTVDNSTRSLPSTPPHPNHRNFILAHADAETSELVHPRTLEPWTHLSVEDYAFVR